MSLSKSDIPSANKDNKDRDHASTTTNEFSKMHVTSHKDRSAPDQLKQYDYTTKLESSTTSKGSSSGPFEDPAIINYQLKENYGDTGGGSSMDGDSVATSPESMAHLIRKDPLYDNVPQTVQHYASQHPTAASIIQTQNRSMSRSVPALPVSEQSIPDTDLELGSMVEVISDITDGLFGVIRWIGFPPNNEIFLVGVELDARMPDIPMDVTDGKYHDVRLFTCAPGRGVFVRKNQVAADHRFADDVHTSYEGDGSPVIEGIVGPMNMQTYDELKKICGKFKGIQGHNNSCYLDATLFSMFAFTNVFDAVLYREPNDKDIPQYNQIRSLLRAEIVNPLRVNKFVNADYVMKLRSLLENICSVKGLTSDEKDPEEFINILMLETLKAEPLLQLNTGHSTFCYQLFVDKDESLKFPSVQQLFDQSFTSCNIKLREVPRCLIIQMPRFGKSYKMYPRILPTQLLDITDVIENDPRQCTVCGQVAEFECRKCFKSLCEETAFCKKCYNLKEEHHKMGHGKPVALTVPDEFTNQNGQPPNVTRVYMDLFAVVCIETSHYVSFVKAGSGDDAPWCFFDSMADRQGGRGGHNVPELLSVEKLPHWISEKGSKEVNESAENDRQLPKLAKRLLCDAYLCMYQCKEVMMYH